MSDLRAATRSHGNAHRDASDPSQATTDFGVLGTELGVGASVRKAPNPLRSADPDRLARYRKDIEGVIAARRAAVELEGWQ